jgi:hypothetical protein
MKRVLLTVACVTAFGLIAAAPGEASTYGKALNASKKVASRACARDTSCTRFSWQCGQPRRQNTQVPCKAYIDEDATKTECLIGITWGVFRNKIYLLKIGKEHCYALP